jgi:hypothetical protein
VSVQTVTRPPLLPRRFGHPRPTVENNLLRTYRDHLLRELAEVDRQLLAEAARD